MRVFLIPLATLTLAACAHSPRLTSDDSDTVLAGHRLEGPSPATPGPYAVRTLVYGSGTDRQRATYRDSVTLRTEPVDASPFLDWPSKERKARERYWGFDETRVPLNARVWYPDGDGPFPLVLVVHGNHDPRDFSDPGYAWLGEHLASRGFVVASVDMNFVNGSIRNENDARGWLLLRHLEAWHRFVDSTGTVFAGQVDLSNVALIGHSRGGEAVAHAAAFNRLERWPDDATIRLGFGYGIRALVAIAPVDGQYRPAERLVPLEDVSYLVFHGSHDGDVTTFQGLRQYQRLRFTGPGPWFKAAVYVYRANHGQWNTVWGAHDRGVRSPRILDLRGLLEAEEQRQFAKVYITTFLEATLKGDRRNVELFRDHRAAGGWLPRTMYITRYEDASFRPIATFEEDVDVTTGSIPGVRIEGAELSTWREASIPYRSSSSTSQENSAVWLGWNTRVPGDGASRPLAASYTLTLDEQAASQLPLGSDGVLSLLLAPTREIPRPRRAPGDSTRGASRGRRDAAANDTLPVDLTVELVDAAGTRARLPLSRYGAIRRPLEAQVLLRRGRDRESFARTYEYVLQTYRLPLADFAAAAPHFDPARVRQVRLVFDRSPAGTVIVDEVGFAQ